MELSGLLAIERVREIRRRERKGLFTMESELRMPSQQPTNKSKFKDSPVFLDPPPRSSPRLQIDNEDTGTQRQQQQQQQQLLQAETPRAKKASDLYARRLSFMSFMTFMSGKSAKSTAAAAEQRSPNTGLSWATRHDSTAGTPVPPLSGPHSPVAVDRASTGSHESEDSVGALPAFGISDRAYLASLVSLFSTSGHGGDPADSSNASHSPLSSALTAPSTIEEGSSTNHPPGPYYEYDVHSPAVYAHPREKHLLVGLPGLVAPPPAALLEFELETLPRLERDLHELSGHFGQRGVRLTYELRMSGPAAADTVTLAPTVWILYRSYNNHSDLTESCRSELQRAVAQLAYLQGRPCEVQEGGGRIELAGDRRLVDVPPPAGADDQIQLSGGGALAIHVQACDDDNEHQTSSSSSMCGALCSVTIEEDDKRQMQSLCRVGGLLLVNAKYILGVTTAHAMLDSSTIFKDSFDNAAEPRSLSGKAVDRDAITAEVGGSTSSTSTTTNIRWHDVTRDAAVDFLGVSMNSRGEMAINRSQPENATDFALLRLRQQSPGRLRNQYTPPGADKPVAITSSASASVSSLDEGPVYILCGGGHKDHEQVLEAQLVWGSACFVVRKRNFHLRRIQTSRPLSKSCVVIPKKWYQFLLALTIFVSLYVGASTAGAWVVRGQVLYGVIIAVYEDEPFALMMTAERLFSNILGSAFSIRSVELWDGVLPDAYRRHEEEQQQQKAKSKLAAVLSSSSSSSSLFGSKVDRGIKVDVRPLSNGSSNGSGLSTTRRGSKQAGAGSFKDTARLNTVKEGIETEGEAGGPSSSSLLSKAGLTTTTAADKIDEEVPIESPKSYGLPHIEASDGLGIDEGVTSAGTGHSFVTASEGTTLMTTPPPPPTTTNKRTPCPPPRGLLHARTESQTSNITMSGAVQTPLGDEKLEKEDALVAAHGLQDVDIEDWHISDWIPGGETDANDEADHDKTTTPPPLAGHFDLRIGPPVRSAVLFQVAEVSSSSSIIDQEGEQGAEAGPRDHVSTPQSWQPKDALEPSAGGESTSMGDPSLLPPPPPAAKRSSQDSRNNGGGGGGGFPRLFLSDSTAAVAAAAVTTTTPTPTTTTNKRLFFLKRRDSQKTGRGSLDDETGNSVVTVSSRDGSQKKSSFLWRFARKKAATATAAAGEKRGKK